MKVYIVKQYQSIENIIGEPVEVYSKLKDAIARCKELNDEYKYGVEYLDDTHPFSAYIKEDADDYHYYIVDEYEVH